MKKLLFVCGGIILLAGAGIVVSSGAVNTAIPDGNPVGITAYQTVQDLSGGTIADVSVNLNISGGYNGDLVGYLTYQDANGHTTTEILLNQVGTTSANQFGASGSGFNVTLSDSGTVNGSIHSATGLATGTWQPDSANTLDGTFGGLTANGTWTLFLADMSVGGGTSILNSWGLNIEVVSVPETTAYGALAGLSLMAFAAVSQFRRRATRLAAE